MLEIVFVQSKTTKSKTYKTASRFMCYQVLCFLRTTCIKLQKVELVL